MAYYIFLKSMRSLEEFRKNPDVKIPPKFPSTNFQSVGKFKNPIFNSEILFLAFGPADPMARSTSGPASPPATPSPRAKIVSAGPSSPCVGRVFAESTFSLSVHAFRAGRLSLISLTTGPRLSDVSSPLRRPTPVAFIRPLRPPRAT
jgi:hypothetical protein